MIKISFKINLDQLRSVLRSIKIGVRVSVFGFKSCVFLAVCGQIRQKFLGTYDQRYEQEIDRSTIVVVCQPPPLPKLGRSCVRLRGYF